MKTLTDKKQVNKVTKDQIIDYLDKKFWEEKQYKCMPENEYGYEYVPREALGRIVDGLIPMIKNMVKQKNNKLAALPLEVPSDGEINAKAIDHKRHESLSTVDYYATGIVVGAKWAINEILKRNGKD